MQSWKMENINGARPPPLCILQTPLGKPKKLCRVCKANGLSAFKTSYKRESNIFHINHKRLSRKRSYFLSVQSAPSSAPRATSHSGGGPHPSTRGSRHHFVFVASFCLLVRRETGHLLPLFSIPTFHHENLQAHEEARKAYPMHEARPSWQDQKIRIGSSSTRLQQH